MRGSYIRAVNPGLTDLPFSDSDEIEGIAQVGRRIYSGDIVWFERIGKNRVAIHRFAGRMPPDTATFLVEQSDGFSVPVLSALDISKIKPEEFIQRLRVHGHLPRPSCIFCTRNAEYLRTAFYQRVVVESRRRSITVPVIVCDDCLKSPFLNATPTHSIHGALALLLIAGIAALGSEFGVVAVLCVAVLGLVAHFIYSKRRQRSAIIELFCCIPAYAILLQRWPNPALHFKGAPEYLTDHQISPRTKTIVLTPTDDRIDHHNLGICLTAISNIVTALLDSLPILSGFDCQIGTAVLPGGQVLFACHTSPENSLSDDEIADLITRLQRIPWPSVTRPVIIDNRFVAGLGSADDVLFEFPFPLNESVLSRMRQETGSEEVPLEDYLMRLGGVGNSPDAEAIAWQIPDLTRLLEVDPDNAPAYLARGSLWETEGNLTFAERDFSEAVRLKPDDPEVLLLRSDFFYRTHQWDRVAEDLDAASRIAPSHLPTLTKRALLHLDQDQPDDALATLNGAFAFVLDKAGLYLSRGVIHARMERFDDALKDFGEAIRLQPEYGQAFLERGRIYAREEKTVPAIEDLSKAAKLLHDPSEAYALRATAYLGEKMPAKAFEDASLAVAKHPENLEYRLIRAEARIRQDKHALAIDDLTFVIDSDPESAVAWGLRGISHIALDENEEGIIDCTKAIDKGSELPEVIFARAVAFYTTGDRDAALDDVEHTLELDPDRASTWNLRGIIRFDRQEFDQAISDFSKAILHAPEWAIPLFHRGNAHACLGEMRHAISDYEKATQFMPGLALAHLNRGIARQELDEHEEAISDFSQAISHNDDFAPAWFQRAIQHLERQDSEAACNDLDRALERAPDFIPAYLLRAQVRHSIGRIEEALADIEEVLSHIPDASVAHVIRGCIRIGMGEHDPDDFENAIRLDPERAEQITIQKLLAAAVQASSTEDFPQSIRLASDAIDLDEECWHAYRIRATSYWYDGQFVEAVADFSRLMRADECPDFFAYRGQVYAEMGEFERAVDDLETALASLRDKDVVRAYAHSALGLAYGGLGRFGDAESEFCKSVVLCPDNPWLYYNQGIVYASDGQSRQASLCFRLALKLDQPRLTPLKRRRATAFIERVG